MSAEHEPTPATRQNVELLALAGTRQEVIASIVGISVPTLKAHYSAELDQAKWKRIAQVAGTVYQAAVGRPARFDNDGRLVQSELKPNLTAGIFILKTQAGWKETSVVEHVDPSAGARDRLAAAVNRALATVPQPGAPEPAEQPDTARLN